MFPITGDNAGYLFKMAIKLRDKTLKAEPLSWKMDILSNAICYTLDQASKQYKREMIDAVIKRLIQYRDDYCV